MMISLVKDNIMKAVGSKMEVIVKSNFETGFKKCNDLKARKFLMNNCPG